MKGPGAAGAVGVVVVDASWRLFQPPGLLSKAGPVWVAGPAGVLGWCWNRSGAFRSCPIYV